MKESPTTDAPIDFGELDEMVGIALIRAHGAAYKYFYRSIDENMKPGYYTSLSLIRRNPGLTQRSLATAARRDPSTIVAVLDALEKRGWIERRRSEADRRAHALFLTPAGAAAARNFDRKVRRLEAEIEARFGAANTDRLKTLLRKLEALFLQDQACRTRNGRIRI